MGGGGRGRAREGQKGACRPPRTPSTSHIPTHPRAHPRTRPSAPLPPSRLGHGLEQGAVGGPERAVGRGRALELGQHALSLQPHVRAGQKIRHRRPGGGQGGAQGAGGRAAGRAGLAKARRLAQCFQLLPEVGRPLARLARVLSIGSVGRRDGLGGARDGAAARPGPPRRPTTPPASAPPCQLEGVARNLAVAPLVQAAKAGAEAVIAAHGLRGVRVQWRRVAGQGAAAPVPWASCPAPSHPARRHPPPPSPPELRRQA